MKMFPSTDEHAREFLNGNCAMICGLSYLFLDWVPLMFKRGELRAQHSIKGDACTDCLVGEISACLRGPVAKC